MRSPSAQLRVSPLGEVELLSTHDQMLGGPSGQSYLGARFPAIRPTRRLIMREAAKIGRALRARRASSAASRSTSWWSATADGSWELYAIEVNLRKGGTTHPFLTLQYLTDGRYDAEAGRLPNRARGQEKCYVASDHVESPLYRVFTPEALFDLVSRHRLHFDHTSQTGVVMHMLSALSRPGPPRRHRHRRHPGGGRRALPALRRGARRGGQTGPGRRALSYPIISWASPKSSTSATTWPARPRHTPATHGLTALPLTSLATRCIPQAYYQPRDPTTDAALVDAVESPL